MTRRRFSTGGTAAAGQGWIGIPVGHTAHLIGQVIRMAMLDGHPDGFIETDRVFGMKNIAGLITTRVAFKDR
ncbi:MAG: hypothetical protein UZ16_OP3001001572 [Candidatus Hinthialibacteria bacterium OLB16]|nr:MAG: hypothetical protein UZ16_OP3001001572 [Candidatus Hinthialibacteria bacterium OLB16]